MEYAENLALDHRYLKDLGKQLDTIPSDGGFHYFSAKKINEECTKKTELEEYDRFCSATDFDDDDEHGRFRKGYSRLVLESNAHFSGIPVNVSRSVVHVPTNVYDGGG